MGRSKKDSKKVTIELRYPKINSVHRPNEEVKSIGKCPMLEGQWEIPRAKCRPRGPPLRNEIRPGMRL